MKQVIIGTVAHVDAGKTTLTEALLFQSGAVKELGRVDHGTAFLDTDALEKSRGITIYAKEARFPLNPQVEVTLLDTPGHVDFSPEMERSLSVLDYAILLISGSDGVQSHTETVWNLLRNHKIPTFLFINKMDLPDLEQDQLMEQVKSRLSPCCCNFSAQHEEDFLEQLALCDESLLSTFVESSTLSQEDITSAIEHKLIFPCFFGSALKLEGLSEFLTDLGRFTRATENNHEGFGAKVFKITRDSQGARLSHVKVTSGTLAVRDFVEIGGERQKITEIRLYHGNKYESVSSVATGTVCALLGLGESHSGDGLGVEAKGTPPVLAPVLTYSMILPPNMEVNLALPLLRQLQEEDPALELVWLPEKQSIQVAIMGDVQLEVLQQVIHERFGFTVEFSPPEIIYRETLAPNQIIEAVGHYEPLRHYAEVQLHLEALPPDSGLHYASSCPTSQLEQHFQNLVFVHLKEKIHTGVLTNSPITDLKITLTSGKAHQKHTEGGDFREATYRALRQGLLQGKSVLLEPWSRLILELPLENVGRAMSDIQRMGGDLSLDSTGELAFLSGSVPISQLGNYQNSVSSYSSGRGKLSTAFLGYRPCGNPASVIASVGYDPHRDPTSTGDSIFCKQGAGYSVPWNQVSAQMHCESSLPPEPVVEQSPKLVQQRSISYANSLAEDDALLEIFQRTYGKISPEKLRKSWKKPEVKVESARAVSKPRGESFLLVDGYNIIFAWEELTNLAEDCLDSARLSLMNTLCNYQAYYRQTVIVVFDAYRVKGGSGSVEKFHNIDVVYTKEAETADMYIEKTTHHLAKNHSVRVATSDGVEQLIILGQGGLRLSARGLFEEVQAMEKAMKAFLL